MTTATTELTERFSASDIIDSAFYAQMGSLRDSLCKAG